MNLDDLFEFYEYAKEGYKNNPKDKAPNFINDIHKELEDMIKINIFLKNTLTQKDNNGTLCVFKENGKYFLNIIFESYNVYNQKNLNILPIEIPENIYNLLENWMKK